MSNKLNVPVRKLADAEILAQVEGGMRMADGDKCASDCVKGTTATTSRMNAQ